VTVRRLVVEKPLNSSATVAVIPAVAGALYSDPAFALLAVRKAGWARLLEVECCNDDHEAFEADGRAVDASLEEIMKTPPTTRAGARAVFTIACQRCERRRQYSVARLIAKHEDAKILFVLPVLTNCPKTQSVNIYDRCMARYEGFSTR
jgi:hypothetical protein